MKIHLRQFPKDLVPVYKLSRWYDDARGDYLRESTNTVDANIVDCIEILEDWFKPLNSWWSNRRKKEEIRIDPEDVWSADKTLSMIIFPVLTTLKEKKAGSAMVDDEDVPDHLKSSHISKPDEHDRWDWVIDEMIWSFGQELVDWEDQYSHNHDQMKMEIDPVTRIATFNHQVDPTKPKYWVDRDGKKNHYDRMVNGRMLFAKYFNGLWD